MSDNNYIGIRVGNKTLDKINFNNKTVFDYSNSKYCSDFLDIFLAFKCDFYCGGDAGIQQLPSLFRKPSIMINAPLYTSNKQTCPEIHDDGFVKLIIFKKIYSLKEKKFVSFSKIMKIIEQWEINEDISEGYYDNTLHKNGYRIINNTPKEIKQVFEEYYFRNNNLWEKKSDEDRLDDLTNNFMIKNSCNKLENIRVGYEFLKNNEDLFL
jgi:putative glycosyltransferase (TIGR04372 family)